MGNIAVIELIDNGKNVHIKCSDHANSSSMIERNSVSIFYSGDKFVDHGSRRLHHREYVTTRIAANLVNINSKSGFFHTTGLQAIRQGKCEPPG